MHREENEGFPAPKFTQGNKCQSGDSIDLDLSLHGTAVSLTKKFIDILVLFIQMIVEWLVQLVFFQFPPRLAPTGQGVIELPFVVE